MALDKLRRCLGKINVKINKSLLATVIAIVLGITLGLTLRLANLEPTTIDWIRIWGELFIRMFKALTLPIILSCVIVGRCFIRFLIIVSC